MNQKIFKTGIIILVVFCASVKTGISQQLFYKNDSTSLSIYHYRFSEVQESGNHIFSPYFYYWKALSGLHPATNLNKALLAIEKYNSANAYENISLQLLKSRIYITLNKPLSALLALNNLKEFFQNNPPDENNEYNQLLWGLYYFYAQEARETNFIYRGYLSSWPAADKNKGLEMLENLKSSQYPFIKTETYYFLSKIYLYSLADKEKSRNNIGWLTTNYPENTIYYELHLHSCKVFNGTGVYNQALNKFLAYLNQSTAFCVQQKEHFKTNNPPL